MSFWKKRKKESNYERLKTIDSEEDFGNEANMKEGRYNNVRGPVSQTKEQWITRKSSMQVVGP